MAFGEFDLIARYFTRPERAARAGGSAGAGAAPGADGGYRTVLGVGDDCALLQPTPGMQWAVSTDMLVEGRHFLSTVAPERLGHKALAVNLSDLAACGARPRAFTLALSMPRADAEFLEGFSRGMFALADEHGIELVGGDTTAGPLNLCITVMGEVPAGAALRRDGARPGDGLWVSHPVGGGIGDARLALEVFRGRAVLRAEAFERVRAAMEQPQPRVALGLALRGVASAAIDLSDGLAGDLGHVLRRSGVGANLRLDDLPVSDVLNAQPESLRRECLVSGGDDYELLFTAADAAAVRAAAQSVGVGVTRIGVIESTPGLRWLGADGAPIELHARGFDHFQ